MKYESPKPASKIVWGPKHLFTKLPKFAARLATGLTAMGAFGIALEFKMSEPPMFVHVMTWAGAIGAGLTAMFGKK